jgi:hypothetical protein
MKSILGVLTILGIFFGAYCYLDARFAKAEEVRAVEQRLDYKIVSDQVQVKQQRSWQLEDRYQEKTMPEAVKEEYRKLKEEIKRLEIKLNFLEQKVKEEGK